MRDEPTTSELNKLAEEEASALREFNRLAMAAKIAEEKLLKAQKRRERAWLWHRADELRKELAQVEDKAANITL